MTDVQPCPGSVRHGGRCLAVGRPGACPTNCILIKFEIQLNFVMLLFRTYLAIHNEIMHTSLQCNCRDGCRISLWSVENILNKSALNFEKISNSIEIPLLSRSSGMGTSSKWLPTLCRRQLQINHLKKKPLFIWDKFSLRQIGHHWFR